MAVEAQFPLGTPEIALGRFNFCWGHINSCWGGGNFHREAENFRWGGSNRVGAGQKSLGKEKSPRGWPIPTGALKVSNLRNAKHRIFSICFRFFRTHTGHIRELPGPFSSAGADLRLVPRAKKQIFPGFPYFIHPFFRFVQAL
jgi:hypothetical protein